MYNQNLTNSNSVGRLAEQRDGDTLLEMMCSKGANCCCAQRTSSFDVSLNVIGASTGLAGMRALKNSRSAELQEFRNLVEKDQLADFTSRRPLIQISQCPGIGKTTLLGLMAQQYPEFLDKARAPEIIGSLVC
jgi:hypothetical protein